MRHLRRKILFVCVSLLVALSLILTFGFDRVVDGVLRPWAVAKVAAAFDSEARLDSLELGWGRLELSGLRLARPGEFMLQAEQVNIRFTVAGFLGGTLEAVTIRQPELVWQGGGARKGKPVRWPQQPPLQVGAWRVEDGRLLLAWGEKRLALRQVEARGNLGSSFAVETAARLGDDPGEPLALIGRGRWEGIPELTITGLAWGGRQLLEKPVTVIPGAESMEVSLALPQLDDAAAASLLRALDLPLPWPSELGWQMAAPSLTLRYAGRESALRLQTAAGEIQRQKKRWPWTALDLQLAGTVGAWTISGLASLSAQARLRFDGDLSETVLRARWRLTAPRPERLCRSFELELPAVAQQLQQLSLEGDLQVGGGVAEADGVRLVARLPEGVALTASLSGSWRQDKASLEVNDLALRRKGEALVSGSLTLAGGGAGEAWQGNWRMRLSDAMRLAEAAGVPLPAALPNLQELELTGKLVFVDGRLVIPAVEVSGRLVGSGLTGLVDARLTVRQLAQGWRFELARLAATQLEYLAPNGLSGVGGGSLRLAGALSLQEELAFHLEGEAAAGEALFGSWYADLGGLPLGLTLRGDWNRQFQRLRLQDVRLDLAGLVSVQLEGRMAGGLLELGGELLAPNLGGVFQQRLRQLADGVVKGLGRLELAGALSVDGAGSWCRDGWRLEATLRPAGVSLAQGEMLRLVGLSGTLPLQLQRGAAAPAAAERLAELAWDDLQVGPLGSGPGKLLLAAGPNRWRLTEPLGLPAAGGRLELDAFMAELPASGPEVQASLKASGIDLAAVSRSLGWPALGGRLGAELPDIRFADEEISSGGEATLQIFEGAVRLRNMRVRQPLSSYPTFHADVDFSGINLQLLTHAFAFGEINGVADGFVHGLRLLGAVPSAFDAAFETRQKGTRNISVKALRNINALSQGGLSAALSQGIYRFIDFYRYRKIGIRCWLRNDVFHLEGTARPDTDTYLIYGGWLPPRIDVIVSTPTISFQEMVKRLKRIERAGR